VTARLLAVARDEWPALTWRSATRVGVSPESFGVPGGLWLIGADGCGRRVHVERWTHPDGERVWYALPRNGMSGRGSIGRSLRAVLRAVRCSG